MDAVFRGTGTSVLILSDLEIFGKLLKKTLLKLLNGYTVPNSYTSHSYVLRFFGKFSKIVN